MPRTSTKIPFKNSLSAQAWQSSVGASSLILIISMDNNILSSPSAFLAFYQNDPRKKRGVEAELEFSAQARHNGRFSYLSRKRAIFAAERK
jgi:hypothetical protein